MKENKYETGNVVILKEEYRHLLEKFNARSGDLKERPHVVIFEDIHNKDILWVVPATTKNHLSQDKIDRIESYIKSNTGKKNFYEPAVINNVEVYLRTADTIPVTSDYISHNFQVNGVDVSIKNQKTLENSKRKVTNSIGFAKRSPEKSQYKITEIKNHLKLELEEKKLNSEIKNEQNNPSKSTSGREKNTVNQSEFKPQKKISIESLKTKHNQINKEKKEESITQSVNKKKTNSL